MLAKEFAISSWGRDLTHELQPYISKLENSGEHMPAKHEFAELSYNSSPCTQFGVVCGRTIKNLIRNPRTSSLQVPRSLSTHIPHRWHVTHTLYHWHVTHTHRIADVSCIHYIIYTCYTHSDCHDDLLRLNHRSHLLQSTRRLQRWNPKQVSLVDHRSLTTGTYTTTHTGIPPPPLHPYRVGAYFFMIMNMVFGNLSAIDLFINERKIFM